MAGNMQQMPAGSGGQFMAQQQNRLGMGPGPGPALNLQQIINQQTLNVYIPPGWQSQVSTDVRARMVQAL